MTRGDWMVVVAIAALAVLTAPNAVASLGDRAQTVIIRGPQGVTQAPLSESARFTVPGHVGDIVVAVEDGSARIITADCPDGVCMRMGPARPGLPVVCAPNAVSVITVAERTAGLDAISR